LWLRRIAAHLGRCDIDELADELSEEEFSRWVALGTIDDWSGEWHTAQICKTVWNALLDLQRRGGMVFASPDDTSYRSETDFLMRFPFEKTKPRQKKKPVDHATLFKRMAGL